MKIKSREDIFKLKIDKPDSDVYRKIKENWNSIAKPLDGLGDFETIVCRVGAITGEICPDISKRAAVIFCSDNGIVEEGVSQSGRDITLTVARALGGGISSACSLGRLAKVDIVPVDIGIDSDEVVEGIRGLKVSKGTANFLKGPAMAEAEVIQAISVGINLVEELKDCGYKTIAMGEMGIGNTTTATAVLCAALELECWDVTGRGAGLDDEGLECKREVIRKALVNYRFEEIADSKERAFEILRCVGGLDIAGLIGLAIGGALFHVPIVIDGLISATSALIADMMLSGVGEYLLPSHKGREKGTELALAGLSLRPLINGNMALGEGTGAIMLYPVLDVVFGYYEGGASFKDYEMEEYKRY